LKRLVLLLVACCSLQVSACGDTPPPEAQGVDGVSAEVDASGAEPAEDGAEGSDLDGVAATVYTVLGHHPDSDAEGVQTGTVLWIDLSDESTEEMTFTVVDDSGASVPGEQSFIGPSRLAFQPQDLLSVSTPYTARLVWPDGEHSWSFTTRSQGYSPVTLTPGSAVFRLRPGLSATMNVVSPPNGGDFVSQVFPLQFVEVTVVDAETLRARIAIGDLVVQGDQQNFCQPTADMDAITFTNPVMTTAPVALPHYADLSQMPLGLTAIPVTFRHLQLQAALVETLAGELSGFAEVSFRGTIDMREMAIGPCISMAGFVPGMQCVGCPGEPDIRECLSIWLTDLSGVLQPTMSLQARTNEQVEADPECGF
jgi:hypothetical protein